MITSILCFRVIQILPILCRVRTSIKYFILLEGLSYRTLPKDAEADDAAGLDPGYYIGRFNSVEWTPSTTPDILFWPMKLAHQSVRN